MELREIRDEINELLEKRRGDLQLVFEEDTHTYYMKDLDGVVKTNFPSVSKVYKKFYTPFDSNGVSFRMAKGDLNEQRKLLDKWSETATYSAHLGSRVHFELEKELVSRYNDYKPVRQPIFECDDEQLIRSNKMIQAGVDYINLMESRNAVLLDTEIVMGDPELGYTGQPDKVWLTKNKNGDGYGFVITDWKSNQKKNFEVQPYTKKMLPPFQQYHDTALSHYFLQLPLYGRLLVKMLQGTKYENIKLLGSIVVLLKDDGTYEEYRVPFDIIEKIFSLPIQKYTRR